MCEVVTARNPGTPDWQLDQMVEEESDRIWAEQNQTDEPKPAKLDKLSFEDKNHSHACLAVVSLDFDSILHYMDEAMKHIPGTPEADKLAGFYNTIADLKVDTDEIKKAILDSMFKG